LPRPDIGLHPHTSLSAFTICRPRPELGEIIAECRDGQKKVLIFSQFRQVLDLCRTIAGEEALILHGDVPVGKRPEIIRKFQETNGFAALVMQIDVGGMGLNLQAASAVILMEPQLKPSTEQLMAITQVHGAS
jgi:SNF2 family DNA or RNA helicase